MDINEARRIAEEYLSKEGHKACRFVDERVQRKFLFFGARLWMFVVVTDDREYGLCVSEVTQNVDYCTPIREP